MCHPAETNHMLVDKTWGILDLSGIHTRHIVYVDFFNSLNTLSLFWLQSDGAPRLTLRSIIFLRKFFAKSKLEERTWAKLVNLNIVHWYYDEPELTPTAIKYEERTRQRKSVDLYI